MDFELLKDLINRINTGIIVVDHDVKIQHWNRWVSKVSRLSSKDVLGQPLISTLGLPSDSPLIPLIKQALQRGMASVLSNTLHINPLPFYQDCGSSDKYVEQQITILPIRTAEKVRHCLIHIQDMSEAYARESLLQQNSQKLKKLSLAVEHSPTSVVIADTNLTIEYVNPKFTILTGYQPQESIGQSLSSLCADENNRQQEQQRRLSLLSGNEWQGEVNYRRKDGQSYWAKECISPIFSTTGEVTHLVIIQEDITEVRKITAQMSYQASHDMLTGLINRREFEVRLKFAISAAHLKLNNYTLFFLDLDQFKVINDTCGHIAGDELLRQVSCLLQQHFSQANTLARLGGDEFVILLEEVDEQQAQNKAYELINLINNFRFCWQDHVFSVGVSIGITHIDINSANYIDVLNEADTACYAAKDAGRNRVQVYRHNDETLLRRQDDTYWANEIGEALEQNRFA